MIDNTRQLLLKPIGIVSNNRLVADDDNWGELISEITLVDIFSGECLNELLEETSEREGYRESGRISHPEE